MFKFVIFFHLFITLFDFFQVVRETCLQMLPGYPSEEFVLITLHTLTLLSGHTRVDIPDQVELLLKYLNEDPRVKVKRRVLGDLRYSDS